MPERMQQHKEEMALVKPAGSTYARASAQVTKKWRNIIVFSLMAFN